MDDHSESPASGTEAKRARLRALLERRAARRPGLPLSFAQQRLWFLHQLDPGGVHYHISGAVRIRGPLVVDALERALDQVIRRHDVLRAVFDSVDGQPVQRILPEVAIRLVPERVAPGTGVDEVARAEARRPFDLARGPLLRARLLRLGDDEHVLVVTQHHLISDGWSQAVLTDEITAFYDAACAGHPARLAPLPIQYADYARWQAQRLGDGALASELAYWEQQLAGVPHGGGLPTDHPRPRVARHRGVRCGFRIDDALGRRLAALGRAEGATPFMTLLAAWKLLLLRATGERDVVVGTPVAGRSRVELEGLIGMFVNTLALRTQLAPEPGGAELCFSELVRRVRDTTLAGYAHQEVPFEKIVERVAPVRDPGRSPLFQTFFVLQNLPRAPRAPRGLALSLEVPDAQISIFDVMVTLEPDGDGYAGTLELDADLFDVRTGEAWLAGYLDLLEAVCRDPSAPLTTLPWQPAGAAPAPVELAGLPDVIAMLDARRLRASEAPAVRCGDRVLGAGELYRRAGTIATALAERGLGAERVVGVVAPRSLEHVVALVGVLEAGAAYLPLDPELPAARLRFMAEHAGASIVLAHPDCHGLATTLGPPVLSVDLSSDLGSALGLDRTAPPGARRRAAPPPAPDQAAYVTYVSGASGRPEPVINRHAGLAGRLRWAQAALALSPADVVLHTSPLAADPSIWEILWPLVTGATLEIAPPGAHRDPAALVGLIEAARVTTCHVVPGLLGALLDEPELATRARSLRQVLCSGEPLPGALAARCHDQLDAALHQVHGPAEAACDALWSPCPRGAGDAVIPIGRPIDGAEAHILDPALRPVPAGAPGELYLGGSALGRGYLGRPALTAERFVPSPFGPPGARLYRTGDAARVRPDGSIELLWRTDAQIRLRGVRIEPREIEAAIERAPGVREAAVSAQPVQTGDGDGGGALVAHVVWHAEPAHDALHDHLRAWLPDVMIPSVVVDVPRLLRTRRGKLDRRALTPPPRALAAAVREAPRPGTEQALAAIWRTLLPLGEVSRKDHFFRAGGHSLLAVRAVSQINRELNARLTVADLFEAPVLAELAARLAARRGEHRLPPLTVSPEPGDAPLSFAQDRLWIIHESQLTDPSAYHVPIALRLRGPLDAGRLERSLAQVVRRHDALRTAILVVDGAPVQRVLDDARVPFAVHDLSGLPAADQDGAIAALFAAEIQQPFALDQGSLLRALLVRLGEHDHVCLITAHHLVTDGWSMTILVDDLNAAYAALGAGRPAFAAPVAARYADYARWQRALIADGVLADQLAYWTSALAGSLPALELPVDHPPRSDGPGREATCERRLSAALVGQLRALAVAHNATLSIALLAGFGALLHRLCGLVPELAIGTAVAGRSLGALEPLVGLFVNTLVIRIDLDRRPSFRELVRRTRARVVAAHDHADLPFDHVQRALRAAGGGDAAFQVFFDYHHLLPPVRLGDVTAEPFAVAAQGAKFDLSLEVEELPGGELALELAYDTARFEPATIARMAEQLERLLAAAAADPELPIGRHDLLGARDYQALIVAPNQTASDWNTADTFVRLFAAQAISRGDAEAVRCDGNALSYRALDAQANRVAHGLIARGVGPEMVVALLIDRSIDYLVAMLGVLKAGAAFLPLDAGWPEARLEVSLTQARAALILAEDRHAALAEIAGPAIPAVTIEQLVDAPSEAAPPERAIHPASLAYVIFTSGSTGVPKGAMIEHRGMLNHLRAKVSTLGLGPDTVLAQTSTQTFDVSVWQLLAPLLCGGRVSIYRNDEAWEPRPLLAKLARDRATVMETVPSHFTLMLDELEAEPGRYDLSSLRWMFLNGEALLPQLCARWLALWPGAALSNSYGATECSDDTTQLPVREVPSYPTRYVPIHGNLPNLTGYVLDADLEPVPPGIAGEMYIGGIGVGRGYLRDPARTAAVFVPDPFVTAPGASGARMYRTGDKVRVLADGTIEFLGRVDHQVKVRGHRIEIGEIESALAGYAPLREACVVAIADGGDARLVAYVVPREQPWPDAAAIAQHLAQQLPDYMVPAQIIAIDALPLLDNGKVNRRALIERARTGERAADARFEPAVGPVETAIAEVWAELLEAPVGRTSNFFELGGHSLLAVQASSRLRRRLGREVSVRDQLEARTVAELARRLAATTGPSGASVFALHPIERQPPRDSYPLSAYQLPEWFIHELEPTLLVFSVSLADVMFVGKLDVDVFVAAWQALVDRHAIFRTTIDHEDGAPVQRVQPRLLVRKDDLLVDRRAIADDDIPRTLREVTREHTSVPFDFTTPPFVVKLVALPGDRFFFIFHTHHIVWDETSTIVMARELAELYNAKLDGREPRLGPPPLAYGDFAAWINRALAEGWLDDQRRYWLDVFRDVPPPLELPTDFPRPPIQTFRGADVEARMPAELAPRLAAFLAARKLTLNVFLHAVLNAVLFKLTGQRDFVVGTPFVNRADQAVEGVLGLFATALPVRCQLDADSTFEALLESTRRGVMAALDHPLYPSILAIQEINPAIDPSRARLFSVMYGLQNDKRRLLDELHFTGLEVRPITTAQDAIEQSAPLELTWVFDHDALGLYLRLDYNTDLFSQATARRWAELFFACAAQLIDAPASRLTELRALSPADEQRVLVAFNATAATAGEHATIVAQIAEACARTPDAIALVDGAGPWTCRELDARANQLARVLRDEGVDREIAVAVQLAPSCARVAVVLAILRAGGCYVPIQTDDPPARQRLVQTAARVHRVICEDPGATGPGVLGLAALWARAAAMPAAPLDVALHPRQRAYVLFTSGSTGAPKGIDVEHGGIVNLIGATQRRYALTAGDAVLALTPLGFDASVLDLFWPLAHGARIVVPAEGDLRNPAAIAARIAEHGVTVFQTVPALLGELVRGRLAGELPELPSLRQVICGGAALPRKLQGEFCAAFACGLANHYGPTEVTVDASVFDARTPGDAAAGLPIVPIGAPIDNARIYLVDSALQPVALGAVGEIVVASPGLARGYLGDPARTAAAFVPDPFSDGGRLYRTGDLGRLGPDRQLQFLGRADRQVKLRGHRIELEEIERQLAEHPAVAEAAVRIQRSPRGDDALVGTVELADGFGRIVEGDQVLQLVTLAQRPELKPALDRLHQQAWPEYFAAGASLTTYWPRLASEFPAFQYALLAGDDVVAAGNAVPIRWDGTAEDLPAGWDDGLLRAFAPGEPDTFFILTGIVAGDAQGRGLAVAVLKAFKSLARALGFSRILVAVRPTGKAARPELAFADYVALRRPDGQREDAWLRTHDRVGGRILKIDPASQRIRAGVAEWQRWAGTTFAASGSYPVKDALQAVRIDLEAGIGEYDDPAVWIDHSSGAGEPYPFQHVAAGELQRFLRDRLPEHMIPGELRLVARLPRTSSGKLDEQQLALATRSGAAPARQLRAPATPTQHVLVEIWRAILESDAIGVTDDFFLCGGHSIRAVQMLLRVTERVAVEVSLREFYREPTITGLERLILARGAPAPAAVTSAHATAASVGFGQARGHHGEIIQGVFEVPGGRLRRGLVSLPCPVLYAEAIFTPDDTGVVRVEPGWKTKACRAAELMLADAAGRTGGHLQLRSNIQVGWGLGSSTCDVLATLRAVAQALGRALPAAELAALAVRAEQASDSIMFEQRAVLFAQRDGVVIEDLGAPLPALDVLGFNTAPDDQITDTLATPRARYDTAEIAAFRGLAELLRRAVRTQDPRLLGQIATASARISQRHLAKPWFDELLALVGETGAIGLQVAHSGTVAGVLFDPRDDQREARILRARAGLAELGIGRIRRFRSSP